jgi:hypothetical protein
VNNVITLNWLERRNDLLPFPLVKVPGSFGNIIYYSYRTSVARLALDYVEYITGLFWMLQAGFWPSSPAVVGVFGSVGSYSANLEYGTEQSNQGVELSRFPNGHAHNVVTSPYDVPTVALFATIGRENVLRRIGRNVSVFCVFSVDNCQHEYVTFGV